MADRSFEELSAELLSAQERARRGPESPAGLFTPSSVVGPRSFQELAAERQKALGLTTPGDVAGRVGEAVQEGAEVVEELSGGATLRRAIEGDSQALKELAFEIGLSVAGGGLGGRLVSRTLGPSMFTRGGRIATGAGRIAGSGVGGVVGGELSGQVPERRLENFLEGAGGEAAGLALSPAGRAAGQLTVRGLRRVPFLRRFVDPLRAQERGVVERGAVEAQEILDRLGRVQRAGSLTLGGPTLTPGQALDAPLLDTVERAVENSFLGGGILRRQQRMSIELLQKEVDNIANQFAQNASRADVGDALRTVLQDSAQLHREATRVAYREVDRLTDQELVNIGPIKAAAKQRWERRARLPGSSTIRANLELLKKTPDLVPFEEAHLIRSHLLDVGFGAAEEIPAATQAFGRDVAGDIGRALEASAKSLDDTGEAFAAFRRAQDLSRLGKERFNESFIGPLLRRSTPEQIFDGAIQARRPTQVRELREIIFDPRYRSAIGDAPEEFWQRIQGRWMQDILTRAESTSTGEVSGRSLVNLLRKQGPDFLRELFPDGEASRLGRTATALMRAQEGAGSGAAPFMFLQAGAAASLGFREEARSISSPETWIILGPIPLALALTRPGLANFLIRGATGKGLGRSAAELTGQLATRLREEDIPFQIRKPNGSIVDGMSGEVVSAQSEPLPTPGRDRFQSSIRAAPPERSQTSGILGAGGQP